MRNILPVFFFLVSVIPSLTAQDSLYLKALAEDQLGQPAKAISTLDQALLSHPGNIRLTRLLAAQYMQIGNYVKAQLSYDALVSADSNDVSSWLQLAEIASFRQQQEEAIHALQEVLRIDSLNLEGLMMMGDILNRNNSPQTLTFYEQALELYPDNQKAAYALSNLYIREGNPQLAIPVCRHILSTDTTSIRFNKLLGYTYYKAGKAFEGKTYLRDATILGDSSAFVFKFLGICSYLGADFGPAIQALDLSEKKDSLDAEVHFFLGASLATTKEKERAMKHLDRSYELMQVDTIVASRIFAEKGNIKRLEEDYKEAYRLYQKSWEYNEQNLMSLYMMASIQDNSMHHTKEALRDYELLISEMDKHPQKQQNNDQMPTIRSIVEDRIIQLKEELFFLDEDKHP